jgi:ABC-type phosphate transport system permease subunit
LFLHHLDLREILLAVPADQLKAALALAQLRGIHLAGGSAVSREGIRISLLALAGHWQTMAVTMVIGNQPKINTSLFAPLLHCSRHRQRVHRSLAIFT